jgi:hypothetical protein
VLAGGDGLSHPPSSFGDADLNNAMDDVLAPTCLQDMEQRWLCHAIAPATPQRLVFLESSDVEKITAPSTSRHCSPLVFTVSH